VVASTSTSGASLRRPMPRNFRHGLVVRWSLLKIDRDGRGRCGVGDHRASEGSGAMIFEKMTRLHSEGRRIRALSLTTIAADRALLDHTEIIEVWMDTLLAYASTIKAGSEDELTIQTMGVRLFNSTACAVDLVLSGFYQGATTHVRDVLEVSFLLADFLDVPDHIKKWRTLSEKDREQLFKPAAVRMRLDDRDGYVGKRRAVAYKTLSKFGGHITPEGNFLLAPNRLVKPGPFFHRPYFVGMIEELAMRLSIGVLAYDEFFEVHPETAAMRSTLLSRTGLWNQKYLASKP
jgi:hypothetical protein